MIKIIFAVIVLLLLAGFILFYFGPRTSIDLSLKSFDLPPDLEQYLAKSESQFSDIIPNTEKIITWADSTKKEKTPLSIIYLHGFSATRQEVVPLCDILARELHANLFYTRLTGHGRSDAAMADATVSDWANDAIEALEIGQRIGERVLVVGTSTGGTLATWLATQDRSDDIIATILISPNFGPKDTSSEALNWPWASVYTPMIIGKTHFWEAKNELQEKYWKTRYPTAALFPMMGLVRLVREADLESIHQPLLFVFSRDDEVVDAAKTEAIFPRIGSANKKIVHINDSRDVSQHVIAGDILSPNTTQPIADIILNFLKPVLNPTGFGNK